MNIGIIGAGNVGKILGEGFVKSGHRVVISSREPHNLKHVSWKQEVGESGDITSFEEAARFGEIIIVALPWSCLKDVLTSINPVYLTNKTVIDVSNAIHFDNGPRLLLPDTSAGVTVQKLLPESHVVKTLNTISDKIMIHPNFKEGSPIMFMCGNDNSSKDQVRALLNDIGWTTLVDLGDIRQSILQESIMIACVISEIQLQSPGSAFALLKH
ncbi:NADPH-dependent F420 reductase [Paenibacillus qinlingensis]|uniref:NADPH-dependent F420 reductase n=1 Tax=Paenibacillus qinlingensis TaxID=1837343 RepID=UPI001566077E|nr:NAD(P)-binding domain-containing protein [Paenibacillus qinlingensis]NQX58003.1 NAD(P)-binding domain-containing protein [Paenibacillus qinlingensis]